MLRCKMSNAQVTGFSLSRNDDPSLESVLADIPFFCVGLTALAVFAFFIVMRRTNSLAMYLYISSIFAFGAGILDLTQILLRGATNADRGLALDTVSGIINTREVGFALAFGFRYFYLWAFVGQRPRYEPLPSPDDPLYSQRNMHSASWERWGVLGFLLKYALLGAVVSIPILQIIWRIVTGNSPMYIAESTIQIAVSVLLIAKLLLNLFLTTIGPWWRPFLPYIVPIIALMISTGIGTGNVLFFKFSETTLGRFLQAVEVYSLIVSVLIFTFYKVPQFIPPTSVAARKRSSFFAGAPVLLPEPEVSTSNVILIGPASADDRSGRVSPITRISSWISRKPQRPTSGELNLWNARDAEMGISIKVQSVAPEAAEEILSPRVQILEDKERPPPPPLYTAEPRNVVPATPNMLEVATPSSANRPYTGVSFASYYGMATNSRLTMPGITPGDETRNTDSPVYGLDGIILPSGSAAPESPILARRPSSPLIPILAQQQRDSANSLDELLRQQRELDKSIAALRIFSSTNTMVSLEPLAEPETKQSDRSVSMSSGNRSEFSLSIFPDPPADRSSVLPDTLIRKGRDAPFPLRVTRRSRRQSRIPRSAVSTKDAEGLFVPTSPAHASSGSAGTQYDVTSFIGDLTTPGPSNESKTSILDDVLEKPESENTESPVIPTATPGSTVSLRPLLLSLAAPSITSLPPATGSSGVLNASAMPSGYEYPALKPLMLSSTTVTVPVVSSPLSAAASAGAGARRTPGPSVFSGPRKPAAPSRRGGERPMISVPRQLKEEVKDEAEAFEKPRRPPALKSDTDS